MSQFRIPNPLGLLKGRSDLPDIEPGEFNVHIALELANLDRDRLEAASERALEVVEAECGAIALGPVSACDFNTRQIELEFTVIAQRSSDLHEKIGHVVKVLEGEFPEARERSSETEASAPPRVAAIPA